MGESDKSLRSIKCTQCAAPLTLHGGHNVRSITCSYCGSVLDSREQYQVVKKFLDRHRPPTPFELGMTGTLKGVEFTIIGLIQFREADYSGWLEFLLFSPTHGYAWLEVDHGHFVFSRRVRDLPNKPVLPKPKSSFKARGRTFRVYEQYVATLSYVEGELTWVAEAGDQVTLTDAIDPPYIYTVERTGTEEEYSFGEYLQPGEVYSAFGLTEEPQKRRTVHPAQPYLPGRLTVGACAAGKYFAPVALLLLLFAYVFGRGEVILSTTVAPSDFSRGVRSAPFSVSDPDKLMGLYLNSPLQNAWAWFDIDVAREDAEIFSMAKQISYYSGYDGGEHWSEGSRSARAYFKLPEAGQYTLFISGEGGTGSRGNTPQNKSLHVTLKEGIIVTRYFLLLLALTTLAFLSKYLLRWRFEAKRWGDDDD